MADQTLATNPLPPDIRVSDARLPATYEQAKSALAACSRIDECQEWANKAEALASYARQADDETLFRLAKRIQGREVAICVLDMTDDELEAKARHHEAISLANAAHADEICRFIVWRRRAA